MKPFMFNLQSVLNHRIRLEEELMSQYRQMQLKENQLRVTYQQLQEEYHRTYDLESMKENIEFSSLHVLVAYRERLKQKIYAAYQQIQFQQRQTRLAYDKWMKAKQGVEMLEKLKDKKHETYLHEVKLEELKQLDEFCITQSKKER